MTSSTAYRTLAPQQKHENTKNQPLFFTGVRITKHGYGYEAQRHDLIPQQNGSLSRLGMPKTLGHNGFGIACTLAGLGLGFGTSAIPLGSGIRLYFFLFLFFPYLSSFFSFLILLSFFFLFFFLLDFLLVSCLLCI